MTPDRRTRSKPTPLAKPRLMNPGWVCIYGDQLRAARRQALGAIAMSLAAAGIVASTPSSRADVSLQEIEMLPGEHWWAGVIAEAHRMPFTAESRFEFDFFANTAGNQGQPLLISDRGRYVWCEYPFRFQFDRGVVRLWAEPGALRVGTNGTSLAATFQHVSRAFFPPSGRMPDELLFNRPQFNTWIELTYNQNQDDVLKYARAAVAHGYPPGVLMIDEGWAKNYGDWDFNRARFANPRALMQELHELGFKVMLWIVPTITPDGQYFKELWLDAREKGRVPWLVDGKNPHRPVLIEWWNGFSALADLTHPYGQAWFNQRLQFLVNTYGVDGFKFDGGDTEHYSPGRMLTPGRAFDAEASPSRYCELFAQLGLSFPLNEYRACWKMGGQALAQRLRDKEHNWSDLQRLIPGILVQGLMGYAFTCPDMIGGGEYLSFRNLDQVDQELIVRAAQCHALMPMMQFSVAPWRVLSPENQERCLAMARLHAGMGDEILSLARESTRTGEPMVRHMDYEFPGQGYSQIIDQFLLGRSILVAPVLAKGARTRTVHFPPGGLERRRWQRGAGAGCGGNQSNARPAAVVSEDHRLREMSPCERAQ